MESGSWNYFCTRSEIRNLFILSIIPYKVICGNIFLFSLFSSYNPPKINSLKNMSEAIYDLIIIWAGAAGMFTAINAPKNMKKCILEKTGRIGTKVLMSGGERCNVSNIDIEAERDYFGKNTKAMFAPLSKFSNYDMINWLESRGVETHIEDRGRIILHSGRATELVDILHQELKKNNTEIYYDSPAESIIRREDGIFEIQTPTGSFLTQKLVIASGGKSFAKAGTDGWWYEIAKQFWHTLNQPFKGLCGMVTREDLSEVSGSTVFVDIGLYDGETGIYSEQDGSFLFTHFGISGPMIYNAVVALGAYLREKWILSDQEANYIKEHISLKIHFHSENLTKKLQKFFSLSEEHMEIVLHINDLRSWHEAKVTWGGVLLDELDKNFQSKLISQLYFIGEVIDITGKTGGFNLQSAWSQGYVVGKSL